jgi:hypothetical protein
MRVQNFDRVRGELLPEMEGLILAEHGAIHRDLLEEPWSRPRAYRWIRYESSDPIARLLAASRRLAGEWAAAAGRPGYEGIRSRFEAEEARRLGRALGLARSLGYASPATP